MPSITCILEWRTGVDFFHLGTTGRRKISPLAGSVGDEGNIAASGDVQSAMVKRAGAFAE